MPRPLRAIGIASRDGDEMRTVFIEGSVLEEEQDILFNPGLQVSHWQKNVFGLAVALALHLPESKLRAPIPAGLVGSFRQQECMTYADFVTKISF